MLYKTCETNLRLVSHHIDDFYNKDHAMRLCRFLNQGAPAVGFYLGDGILPLAGIAEEFGTEGLQRELDRTDSLLPFLAGGEYREEFLKIQAIIQQWSEEKRQASVIPADNLLVPVPNPAKLLLLAGNYSKHIAEGGGRPEEREQTFPYVFMKPPTTTLTNPGDPVRIPECSPDKIDWELELGVIIGRTCKSVSEADALNYVAGYTIINDISDRGYRPNPGRTERDRDSFFDWLHGKWHDTFCPMGPCVISADELPDPQAVQLTLRLNGEIEQHAPTSEMIFPVASIIEFLSQSITLEPGDVISTGTPAGVGSAKQKFLKPGDLLEAEISQIGILKNPVI